MREAVLIIALIVLVIMGLGNARIALLSYVWFAIMRPDVLAWASDKPYSFVLGIVATLSCVREFHHLLPALQIRWLVGLVGFYTLLFFSVIFSTDLESSLVMFRVFLPTLFTSLLLPVVIREYDHLRKLFLVMGFSLGFIGLKFGLWGVVNGGVRITGGYGGSLSDNNLFALGMVIGLPICWYARDVTTDVRLKWMFLAFAVFTPAAIVMSHSRGGILAFGVSLLFVVFFSRHRFLAVVVLGVFLAGSFVLVQDSLLGRLSTISNYEEDASAVNRLAQWKGAVRMSLDHPLFGVGFGGLAYTKKISDYIGFESMHFAHNNYVQILADCGYPAAILFCIMLFGMILWFLRLGLKFRNRDTVMYSMAMGMCASLVGFAVGSIFLSRTYYETIYYLLAFGATYSPIAIRRLQELDSLRPASEAVPAPSPLPGPPTFPLPLPDSPSLRPQPPAPARFKLGGRERTTPPGGGGGVAPYRRLPRS